MIMDKKITLREVSDIYHQPFNKLLYQAQTIHQKHFNNEIELCTLLSIKTGSCPEDCQYCPQSGHYNAKIKKEKLLDLDSIMAAAKKAKKLGAKRFCMGAAWRNPPDSKMPDIIKIIDAVKRLGLETCMTLGMLSTEQAKTLSSAGLDYYNHNLDSSEKFYQKIISTRSYQDRLKTLKAVSDVGIKVCCGGILGMGECLEDRLEMLVVLANLDPKPQSVPINQFMPIAGTPLGDRHQQADINKFDFIKIIALARIIMPHSRIRLSAGRDNMSDEMQALCFLAGANSIFYGDTLLTASNPSQTKDIQLLKSLGFVVEKTNQNNHNKSSHSRQYEASQH